MSAQAPYAVLSDLTLSAVQAEAVRAYLKHGGQSMAAGPSHTQEDRFAILAEEGAEASDEALGMALDLLAKAGQLTGHLGAVARELNEIRLGNHDDDDRKTRLVIELIQTAAMALTWVETLEGDLSTPDNWPGVAQAMKAYARPPDRPRVVCLCGSSRFYAEFQQANYDQTMRGEIVLSIGFYPHAVAQAGHGEGVGHDSEQKKQLDELHKRKIDLADSVLVVSDATGYYGASTTGEIRYALEAGKTVEFTQAAARRRFERQIEVQLLPGRPPGPEDLNEPGHGYTEAGDFG